MEQTGTVWDGVERRNESPLLSHGAGAMIPVAVLQYMDTRLASHMERIESVLKEHTVEEMERYREIVTGLQDSARGSEVRHAALLAQMTMLTARNDLIEGAFTNNEKGVPDFMGHKLDHSERKKLGDWLDGTKRGVIAKVLEWGAVVLVAYVLLKVAPQLLTPVLAPGM
jgi:hypothetical protein